MEWKKSGRLAVPIKRIRSVIKKQENEGRLLKKKRKKRRMFDAY